MPDIDINRIFIENLKTLIKENKMTNAEFADKIGVRPSTVSMWMRGTNSPRMELLDKIADLFGISVSDLMTDTNSSVIRQDLSEMYEMLVSLTSREDIQPINHVTAADLSTMHSKFLYYTKLLQDLNPDELNDVKHYIEFVKSKRADTE
ncbi:helix-turn-helix transcriptional regulator [Lachnospiraceae bacterium 62-26]